MCMAAYASPFTFLTYILIFPLSSLGWNFRDEILPPGLQLSGQNKGCHSHLWVQQLPSVSQRVLRELRREIKNSGSDSWGAHQKSDSNKPRHLHPPKAEFLNLRYLVFYKSFVPTTFPLLQNLIYPSSPLHLLSRFSQGFLRCCLQGLSLNFASNKI